MMITITIPEEVKAAVANTEYEKKKMAWYEAAKKAVSYKQAVVNHFEELDEDTAKSISTKEIKILPVKNNKDEATGYFAIFNIAEIDGREYSDHITMEVPAGKEGLVLGAGKWQPKEWVKASWLRKLHVFKIWVKGV